MTLIQLPCSPLCFTPGKNLACWLTEKGTVANTCLILTIPSGAVVKLPFGRVTAKSGKRFWSSGRACAQFLAGSQKGCAGSWSEKDTETREMWCLCISLSEEAIRV